ncbi:Os07g0213300, partial [Oryza sativa Japonica Group]
YFEIIASCTMIRDWKTASEMIEYLDSSLSSISVGTLNHVLNFLGKCGKTENMMKLFYKMVTSCSTVGLSTYAVVLRNLLVVGKWRKYIEVLQWMEDSGVHPTLYMFQNVLPYIWRENGMDFAATMQEKISSLRDKQT